MNNLNLPQVIKFFRKKSGLTQFQLGQLAGVGKTAIFDLEKGKETIQLNTLLKVLAALNIKIKLETPFPYNEESK